MINVRLDSFVIEDGGLKKTIDDEQGWIVWRSLGMVDVTEDAKVGEWYYVAACNQYYYDKVASKEEGGVGYYVQNSFDEEELFSSVKKDFDKLSFKDWDEFHSEMPKHFIHDPTD